MCGITGIIHLNEKIEVSRIEKMTEALNHRGPDGNGFYRSQNERIALGHTRLSFLDLSEDGKQPMSCNEKEITITFNGEIYNFQELKAELEGSYQFQSNTDTEVIIAGYKKWGISVVNRLKGMFAFALLDENNNKMFLVRDRFGIKPLYYTLQSGKFLFASELKAIHAAGEVEKELDYSSFVDYFVYRYIPSPKTIWKNIQKLPPAHYAIVDTQKLTIGLSEYWELNASERTDLECDKKVGSFLLESVKQHSFADVPVGSFLSGGYDSSALVHYMSQLGYTPNTFSIGFSNWEKSEDQYAQIVANHLKVPNDVVIADDKSLNLVELMPVVYDEPIADISIVPTFMVSELARRKVKAVLSGEGADELFCGYTWQHEFNEISNPESWLGKIKKKWSPPNTVQFYAHAMAMGWFDQSELKKMLEPEFHRFIPEDVHWFYRKHFKEDLSPVKSIQYMDMKCFMGELVLTKVDRASMANSLEVRVPFLDHQLFEYVFQLQELQYIRKDQTKHLLYKNIESAFPKRILDRRKQGFVGPDAYYMDLNWYKEQLKQSRLVELGIVRQAYINNLLEETYNWKLWKILIMEKWIRKWI